MLNLSAVSLDVKACSNHFRRDRSTGASYLVLDGHVVIDNGGDHDSAVRDGELYLEAKPVPVVIYFGNGEKLSLPI